MPPVPGRGEGMKATTRRGAATGALPAAKTKKKKKKAERGFMCGCGGFKSVSADIIPAVTATPMKKTTAEAATTAAAKAASSAAKKMAVSSGCRGDDAGTSAEGTPPSVDTLLRQLRDLERGVRALGVREREDDVRGGRARQGQRHRRSATRSDWGGGRRLEAESVAVVTESANPLGDFRRSMVQMIVENGITGGAELRELLQRFLSLNSARHHHLILRAFADVWEQLFAAAGPGHGHARAHRARPPPLPPLPASEIS